MSDPTSDQALTEIASHELVIVSGGADEKGSSMSPGCVSQGEWLGEGVRTTTYGLVGYGVMKYVERKGHLTAKAAGMGAFLASWGANTAESIARTAAKTLYYNRVCGNNK